MRTAKRIIVVLLAVITLLCFTGCTEADRVTHNVKQEADNFNVTRRLVVINSRSDKVLLELIGRFSINVDDQDHQLEVTCETDEDRYLVDYININEWTTYTVEDLSGANVNKYHYEVNYLPEGNILPFTLVGKE